MTAAKKIQSAPHISSPLSQQSSAKWNTRVLVVDDEIEIGKAYAKIFADKSQPAGRPQSSRSGNVVPLKPEDKRYQFDVVVCSSAQQALSEIQSAHQRGENFAMGFFDVRLGEGMDGIDLVKAIHQIDPDLFAVFVTAYNDRNIDSINETLGVNHLDRWDYMNKPFNESEIIQKARNFTTLWNLRRQSESQSYQLAELNRRVLEGERLTSVAAVARGVAHEFGNLLMQIIGKAEISRTKSESEMREALDRIVDASHRANVILDRFNNLSSAKPIVSEKEYCFVDDVLKEALDLMAHQFKTNNIKVCIIKKDHVEAYLNSTSLLQIFVNLMINSMHAMGSPGQIDLSIQNVNSEFVEIRVRDYGPGVKPEILDRITEAFFTTKGDKGTGLGLSICREIVEVDHLGEFKVQNHPAKGFEVVIRLPKKAAS